MTKSKNINIMKRFTYLLLLCILTIGNVQAQDEEIFIKKTSFGIKGGINALAIKTVNENSDSVYKKSGFYFGAFVNIPSSEFFSIQPEVNYASGEYTYNDNINLLHIPVLLKFEIGNGFSGYIGPESVILLSLDDPLEDKFNTFMFGFTFGGTYNFTEDFSLEMRPYLSITKFLDDGPGLWRRYNTLQIGLAYKF